MPHLRKRHLQKLIEKLLTYSPIVGVLGHRQVGKTTLIEGISNEYLTFDDEDTLSSAQKSAKNFLSDLKTMKTSIDECQLVPKIFPALKERVRLDKRPGQFILSGSVRFTSKQAIRESLTGRLMSVELLPFTIGELRHQELSASLRLLIDAPSAERMVSHFKQEFSAKKHNEKYIDLYFERGGLPGICFIQDQKIRNEKIQDQLATILDRDLRQVHHTTLLYNEIKSFLLHLAEHQGEELNSSEIKRKLGLSHLTQKKLLYSMEAVFLIRQIPIEGKSAGRVYYLEDQAEVHYLSKNISTIERYEQLVYRNLRAEFYYQIGENFKIFQYKTRGNARIPFCFETKNGIIGILPILNEELSLSQKASIKSFLGKYINSKILVVTRSNQVIALNDRVLMAPLISVI